MLKKKVILVPVAVESNESGKVCTVTHPTLEECTAAAEIGLHTESVSAGLQLMQALKQAVDPI